MTETEPLTDTEFRELDAWWRAANYLSVGQIYLLDNPLLTEPLRAEHVKPRLLGHWGTTPGLNLIYAHLNRMIRDRDLDMIYIAGPGHGGPGLVAGAYLDGTYTEMYPSVTRDTEGMRRLFRQFSFPGGIPSHVAPETPGSIHEGGELGYSLAHAYGAAFDNPGLLVACVIGDGEAETGALAASWHSNKFLNPARDGAVLPILHLNGYKIANPTVLARHPRRRTGRAARPATGTTPHLRHRRRPRAGTQAARRGTRHGHRRDPRHLAARPRWPATAAGRSWPMIILRTPEGLDRAEGRRRPAGRGDLGARTRCRSPQPARTQSTCASSRSGCGPTARPSSSTSPGASTRAGPARAADGRRMSANPHANGGLLLQELRLPDFRDYAVEVKRPGTVQAEGTRVLGTWLRDVIRANQDNFRLFGPDETASNRLGDVFDVTDRAFDGTITDSDDHLAPDGRVMEVLSEHLCQGWLEGYLLTGRHGVFNCYEAFIHIIDSMFNQHAKWLKTTRGIEWRRPVASLNYLLSSLVWRQDHNGFSHQDPGFIDHVVNKKAEVIRVYLPPDANTLLSVADHCLRSRNYVNVIVAGKQPEWQWLSMDEAVIHCTRGAGIWDWAPATPAASRTW